MLYLTYHDHFEKSKQGTYKDARHHIHRPAPLSLFRTQLEEHSGLPDLPGQLELPDQPHIEHLGQLLERCGKFHLELYLGSIDIKYGKACRRTEGS